MKIYMLFIAALATFSLTRCMEEDEDWCPGKASDDACLFIDRLIDGNKQMAFYLPDGVHAYVTEASYLHVPDENLASAFLAGNSDERDFERNLKKHLKNYESINSPGAYIYLVDILHEHTRRLVKVTPLQLAAITGNWHAMHWLLAHGAHAAATSTQVEETPFGLLMLLTDWYAKQDGTDVEQMRTKVREHWISMIASARRERQELLDRAAERQERLSCQNNTTYALLAILVFICFLHAGDWINNVGGKT